MDWHATRRNIGSHTDAQRTILANGANTKDRSARHFGACDPSCEHGCSTADTIDHRLMLCEGTHHLRSKCFTPSDLACLARQPQATKQCAVWSLTQEEAQSKPPESLAWTLWPKEVPLRTIVKSVGEHEVLQVHFAYAAATYGSHPLLQRHACMVQITHLATPLHAYATKDAYSRQQWEADTLLLGCILHSMTKLHITVSGFATALPALFHMITQKEGANAYLSELIPMALPHVSKGEGMCEGSIQMDSLGWSPTQVAIDTLEEKWQLSAKVAKFHAEAFTYYPIAHAISSRQRQTGQYRGGLGRCPERLCVSGGPVCVCRLHCAYTPSSDPHHPHGRGACLKGSQFS